MWMLAHAVAADPQADSSASFLVAAFERTPSDRQRRRFVRKVLGRAGRATGGKDWGKAICFAFDGPPDTDAIARAIHRTGIDASVRSAETCLQPPPEVFLPDPPDSYWRLTLAEPSPPFVARDALSYLFETSSGVTGIMVAVENSDRVCLEVTGDSEPAVLELAVSVAELPVVGIEPVADCGAALATGP